MGKMNVLYIAGAGRGGSTLLGDVLGMLPGSLHIGELRGVFDYVTDEAISCSCQKEYIECPFWRAVFERLYGNSWRQVIRSLAMEGRVPRSLRLPLLWLCKLWRKDFTLPLERSLREVVRLLRVVESQEAFRVLVDSSKAASFAWLLAQQPEVRIAVVHLVRDPRASLFSWTRRPIPIFDREARKAFLRTRTHPEAARDWIKATMGAYLLKVLGLPYMRVKYEELSASPALVVERIVQFAQKHGIPLEQDDTALCYLRQGYVVTGVRHLLGGNPGVKSKAGMFPVREDVAWLREMPVPQRLLWTIIFLPWILWLGYSLWPADSRSDNQPT